MKNSIIQRRQSPGNYTGKQYKISQSDTSNEIPRHLALLIISI